MALFLALALLLLPGYPAAAAIPDPLVNGGFEQAGATSSSAFDWQPFGSGYTRVSDAHSGAWGARLRNTSFSQFSGAYQRVDLEQTELKPVFIGGFVKGFNISNAPSGYFGAGLYAEIHLQDGSVAYWNSIANFGSFPWRWIGFNTGSVALVNQPIDYLFVVPILGNARGTATFDDIAVTEFNPTQAAVTLMFDDGEENAYTAAKPVLDSYGFVGSAAIITEMIDEPDFMSAAQLQDLAAGGWEIASHSITHSDLTTLSRTAITRELRRSKLDLEELGFTVKNFALPFGAYNGAILAEGAKYYSSVRAFEQGQNPQGTFPFDVKVRGVINSTTPAELEGWINQALLNKQWVVIVFHKITEVGDDAFYTPPAAFAEMLAAVAGSGVPVLTYNQGLELFRVSP